MTDDTRAGSHKYRVLSLGVHDAHKIHRRQSVKKCPITTHPKQLCTSQFYYFLGGILSVQIGQILQRDGICAQQPGHGFSPLLPFVDSGGVFGVGHGNLRFDVDEDERAVAGLAGVAGLACARRLQPSSSLCITARLDAAEGRRPDEQCHV